MSLSVPGVDDSAVMRHLVRRSLELAGLDASPGLEARDGAEALQMLAARPVGLELTDLNMPRMDGFALLRRMADDAALRAVPAVVVTSDRCAERIDELRRCGVRGFLPKPFRPESLVGVVRRALAASGERP